MGDQLIILILLVSLLIVLGEEGEGEEVQVDKTRLKIRPKMR